MVIIRPARRTDLDHLVELAGTAGFGLTNLPKDRDLLARRLAQSKLSFQLMAEEPRGELYIFVMEDTETGKVIGTSCIVSKVGGFEPFYAYRINTTVHESLMLHIRKEIQILHLVAEHSGPCEIGGLFIAPEYRKHGNGRLLSLFRFLFMAERPASFEPVVIAEMRGVVNQDGRSPFWEALGRHFFDIDFSTADYLSVKNKRFIADLMPTCPIYVPLLPEAAQKVIGKVHESTEPALKMLRSEGFKLTGMVDIFEAGPIISCPLNEIRIVRESGAAVVHEITDQEIESVDYIITNTVEDFRACVGPVFFMPEGGVRLNADTAQALKVTAGDRVRFGPLRPLAQRKENG
jgi:arginine N-succinyltransferase